MTEPQAPSIAEELRGAGLRVTAARAALLVTVREGDHLGVEAIAAGVRERVGHISLQAVYDVLEALTAAGLVRRIQPAGARPATRRGSATTTTTSSAGPAAPSPTSTAPSARRPA